jgi:hypothetical protein
MTDAVAGRIAQACREGKDKALVLDGWPRGPYQLERSVCVSWMSVKWIIMN